MTERYLNLVDGEWVAAATGETFENRNPADTDDLIGEFQRSGTEDADAAVNAAVTAKDEWASTPAPERGRILTRAAAELEGRKEELTETLVREEGKAHPEAAGEVQRAIDIFDYYGSKARDLGGELRSASGTNTRLYTVQDPVGVAALITPWNYPIAIPAWKLAPALATGNTVVFKPASEAPNVARKLVDCLDEAGLPGGVLNFVTGPGSSVGQTFTTHEEVDAVSFTGSSNVGNKVYEAAAPDQKRVQLEMGGKNPTVVTESANVDVAAEIVATGAFGVTGQACTATSRAIVHESKYDEFVDRVVQLAEEIDIGSGLDGAEMGPQVNKSELVSTLDYVEVANEEGATLETGGERLDSGVHEDGYFVEPTVFSDVNSSMRIASEEVFGPVLAIIPVESFNEAVSVANDVEYGLSASIVTDDHSEANRFIDDVEAGIVKINEKTTGLELHVPFGGLKSSSSDTYREQGDSGLDFYTTTRTVYDNY